MDFRNILLAEDDTDDYKFLLEAFKKISPDSNIIRAVNGLGCITYLKKNEKPDIIFLDLNMPIKSGLDCLRFIKDNNDLESIPVVIYSTSHYIKDIDLAYKGHAHYYIVKPVCVELLADVLLKVINNLNASPGMPGKKDFVVRINAETENQSLV